MAKDVSGESRDGHGRWSGGGLGGGLGGDASKMQTHRVKIKLKDPAMGTKAMTFPVKAKSRAHAEQITKKAWPNHTILPAK